ncbi:hypothetical protein [Sediminicurvatus halobius]|uniref:hypothetical protein n=1 Tax=Sediminicurvatus halobius TaxID=2182432 RepID=UPI0011B263A7|nr:hypothetical protein [Spiribacter halobius]UEX76823.1 hypothetical protein LMH63_12745 [Spiribacter halobius]
MPSVRLERRIDRLALQLQTVRSARQRGELFALITRLKADRRLEVQIETEAWKLSVVESEADQRAAFEAMQRLIAQRTPERVREMEREQGLG